MLRVSRLTKRFGSFTAVEDLSFEVRAGETFALLGPNGSGKTTTLKCLAGLTVPDGGQVWIDGLDVFAAGRETRRRSSFLPQRAGFPDNLTAREILGFYRRLRKLPEGCAGRRPAQTAFCLDGFADRAVAELSGGMLQRLGVAVVLAAETPLLLLDEPTASLDPAGAIAFRDVLRALKREGRTIVLSTHVLSDAELLADRVGVIVGGKLVADESIAELRRGLLAASRLRISLANPEPRLARVALDAGGSTATVSGDALLIESTAESRLQILRAIQQAGGEIERFSTEDPSLEEIYLRYMNENGARAGTAGDGRGLRTTAPGSG